MTYRLTLPLSLTTSPALPLAAKIAGLGPGDEVELDVSRVKFSRPLGALLVASELRAFVERGGAVEVVGFEAAGPAHYTLAHHGFYRSFGVTSGPPARDPTGTESYLPIMWIARGDLEARMAESGKALGPTIQAESQRMAHLLTQSNEGKVLRPIAYCFREAIRNVFEHAHTDLCAVSAQVYKTKDHVEIAIVDRGRGVRASLAERHDYGSDAEALQAAVVPGVTRAAPAADDPAAEEDKWANSGFGLWVLSELGRRTGCFTLVSGSARLERKPAGEEIKDCVYAGTALSLTVTKPKGVNFEEFVYEIIEEGNARSRTIGGLSASKSTRILA